MQRTDIVIGILYDKRQDTVLVCLRPSDRIQGGKWEFPGGKCEPDETSLQALKRELYEEVDIFIESAHPLIQVEHDYPEGPIRLHAWIIDRWSGSVRGKEGQKTEWIAKSDLPRLAMPLANRRILDALALPPLYLITPDLPTYDEHFLRVARQLISHGGLRLLQFRSKLSTFSQHRDIVTELIRICDRHACKLIYNGSFDLAQSAGAHGVHLDSIRLLQSLTRPPDDYLVSASCHTIDQVIHATRLGLDFCVISPVYPTDSHPGQNGIGWERFSQIAAHSGIPVYALGGIRPEHLVEANRNGAHGVSMISGIWSVSDPLAALQRIV